MASSRSIVFAETPMAEAISALVVCGFLLIRVMICNNMYELDHVQSVCFLINGGTSNYYDTPLMKIT